MCTLVPQIPGKYGFTHALTIAETFLFSPVPGTNRVYTFLETGM